MSACGEWETDVDGESRDEFRRACLRRSVVSDTSVVCKRTNQLKISRSSGLEFARRTSRHESSSPRSQSHVAHRERRGGDDFRSGEGNLGGGQILCSLDVASGSDLDGVLESAWRRWWRHRTTLERIDSEKNRQRRFRSSRCWLSDSQSYVSLRVRTLADSEEARAGAD